MLLLLEVLRQQDDLHAIVRIFERFQHLARSLTQATIAEGLNLDLHVGRRESQRDNGLRILMLPTGAHHLLIAVDGGRSDAGWDTSGPELCLVGALLLLHNGDARLLSSLINLLSQVIRI
jgi:hypothetical protein